MEPIQQFLLRPWLYLIIVIIGIALKFYGIESKYFWYDEIETIMHSSGISDNAYPAMVPLNEVKNISFYYDLLHLNTQHYTIGSQLKGLFSMPQLAPLHPALLIFWHRIAGDDFIHYRLFNVFIFLLTLPFLFLLCKTLFKSNLAGWIAISLFSISPFFNAYTQEARYIILWAFFVIAIHAVFLQAISHNKLIWWIGYTIIAILLMYTSLLSAIVLFGHCVYIWILRKDLRLAYSLCVLIVFLVYLPWIVTMFNTRDEILRSMYWHTVPARLKFWMPLVGQGFGFAHIFESFEEYVWVYVRLFFKGDNPSDILIPVIINILILVLIIASIFYLLRRSDKKTLSFLLLITLPFSLFIYILDIVRNGRVSFIWRYQIISFIGIFLILVYFLYKKINMGRYTYSGIYIGLIIIGIASIFKISNNKCWTVLCTCNAWENYNSAKLFSTCEKPLLITDFTYWAGMGGFLEVIANCQSDNVDVLYASPDNATIKEQIEGKEYSEIFIVHASSELVQNLKLQFKEKVDSLEIGGWTPMWQIRY